MATPASVTPYLPWADVLPNGRVDPQAFPQVRRTTFIVDSRDRERAAATTSSAFTVTLPEPLHNVSSAMLIGAEIPLSYYAMTAARGNTSLRVTLDGTPQTVTVPDGNYTTATLAAALKSVLDTAFGTAFTITFDAVTLRCTVAATGTVTVDGTGLGYNLGFAGGATGTNAATGSRVAQLSPEAYFTIEIEELNGVVSTATRRRVFSKVQTVADSYTYTFNDRNPIAVELRPPRARLDKITVSLRFRDGTLVDLNGADWSMTIELASTVAQ